MKQHALTHKTQDGTTPVSTTSSNSGDSSGTPTTSAGMMPTSFDGSPVLPSGNRSDCSDAGNMSDSSNVDMRMEATAASLKRSPPQHEAAGLPMPKRPHGKLWV